VWHSLCRCAAGSGIGSAAAAVLRGLFDAYRSGTADPLDSLLKRKRTDKEFRMGAAKGTASGSALVVGGGIAGMQAALDLADSGYRVHLVEKSSAIGGVMSELDKTFPTNDCAM
jgi:heterodisulfide reductase subunit A